MSDKCRYLLPNVMDIYQLDICKITCSVSNIVFGGAFGYMVFSKLNRSWIRFQGGQTKGYEISIFIFSAQHAAVGTENEDCFLYNCVKHKSLVQFFKGTKLEYIVHRNTTLYTVYLNIQSIISSLLTMSIFCNLITQICFRDIFRPL